jgi:hypothetical protein
MPRRSVRADEKLTTFMEPVKPIAEAPAALLQFVPRAPFAHARLEFGTTFE